jgi:hypothetical protein
MDDFERGLMRASCAYSIGLADNLFAVGTADLCGRTTQYFPTDFLKSCRSQTVNFFRLFLTPAKQKFKDSSLQRFSYRADV